MNAQISQCKFVVLQTSMNMVGLIFAVSQLYSFELMYLLYTIKYTDSKAFNLDCKGLRYVVRPGL